MIQHSGIVKNFDLREHLSIGCKVDEDDRDILPSSAHLTSFPMLFVQSLFLFCYLLHLYQRVSSNLSYQKNITFAQHSPA